MLVTFVVYVAVMAVLTLFAESRWPRRYWIAAILGLISPATVNLYISSAIGWGITALATATIFFASDHEAMLGVAILSIITILVRIRKAGGAAA